MAGLVTARPVYRTCGKIQCGSRASPTSDAIHDLLSSKQDVDASDERGHDENN
jgi:hypothetical protein